jgi:prevent-host-death family protein
MKSLASADSKDRVYAAKITGDLDPVGISWLDVAMKSVKIAELKDRLSEHLRAVEQGAEVIVTDRNRPIARIVPLGSAGGGPTLVPPQVPFSAIRDRTWRAADWSVRSDELLAEERGDR